MAWVFWFDENFTTHAFGEHRQTSQQRTKKYLTIECPPCTMESWTDCYRATYSITGPIFEHHAIRTNLQSRPMKLIVAKSLDVCIPNGNIRCVYNKYWILIQQYNINYNVIEKILLIITISSWLLNQCSMNRWTPSHRNCLETKT